MRLVALLVKEHFTNVSMELWGEQLLSKLPSLREINKHTYQKALKINKVRLKQKPTGNKKAKLTLKKRNF